MTRIESRLLADSERRLAGGIPYRALSSLGRINWGPGMREKKTTRWERADDESPEPNGERFAAKGLMGRDRWKTKAPCAAYPQNGSLICFLIHVWNRA